MEPAKKIVPNIVSRLGSDSPVGELTWECTRGKEGNYHGIAFVYQGCGLVAPTRLPSGRYIRRSCACEQHAHKLAQEKQEREMWMMQDGKKTFNWIGGGRWSEDTLRLKTFANFKRERQPTAFETANMFASLRRGTLILHGTYGTGKTHLLAAICNHLVEQQTSSRFITAPKLFGAIQAYIQSDEDYHTIIRSAIRTPLLVIDDVDKAKRTDFREEVYFEIVDARVNRGLPIALSTNKLASLEQYVGGAVCSRLSIGQIAIEMTGADYRLEL